MAKNNNNLNQVFGSKSSLRNRLATLGLAITFFVVFFWLGGLTVSILQNAGPSGQELMTHQFGLEAPSAPYRRIDPLAIPTETAGSEDGKPTKSKQRCGEKRTESDHATFTDVYTFIPEHIDWIETSIQEACGAFDVAMPQWFELNNSGFSWTSIDLNPNENSESIFKKFTKQFDLLPVVNSYEMNFEDFPEIERFLFLASVAREMTETIEEFQLRGLCIDASRVDAADMGHIADLLALMKNAKKGPKASVCVIINSANIEHLPMKALSVADKVVVKAFRDAESGLAGPQALAPQAWFENAAREALEKVGYRKLVLMLGVGSVEWSQSGPNSELIGFAEAMRRYRIYGGQFSFPEIERNSKIDFVDAQGRQHIIWNLDAASTFNQLNFAHQLGIAKVGIWGLGKEDPGIWEIFRFPNLDGARVSTKLKKVDLSNYVRYSGVGPFFDFRSESVNGERAFTIDSKSGLVTDIRYTKIPSPFHVERWGLPNKKMLSFTFDDGPDAIYTGQVLDVLSEYGVRATFFPVGRQMLSHQAIIKRIESEGHLIGSHTFNHPDLGAISETRAKVEMNMQSRVQALITGKEPVLFRAPYISGGGPFKGTEAKIMSRIHKMGYITAGSDIVPPDWEFTDPVEISDYIVDKVLAGRGNVILLHDGGGDRTATIQALPMIIQQLRSEGFSFGDLADLAGTTRNDFMPPVSRFTWNLESVAISAVVFILNSIKYLFWLVIGLGVSRSTLMLVLALKRGRHAVDSPGYTPTVTVIVPAYNEEKVITRTIETILQSDYENLSVLVVDDGSKDNTRAVVEKLYKTNPRVRVFSQRNQGKWSAANNAYRYINSEIVVGVDADTLVDPSAIRFLVQKMADPNVAAVAGNVKVGNTHNLLTRMQAIEYITAQNIDRRAFELLKGMMVVPGAIGAWRVSAVKSVGLYSADTMTEDADLTVALLRRGYKIVADERAYTYTEAPETVRAFLAQRLRWTLGMMQTGWKHKKAIREGGTLGRFTLFDLAIFGVFVPIVAPVIDTVMLVSLLSVLADLIAGRPILDSSVSMAVILGYLMLPILELVVAFTAFRFERSASYSLLFYLPLQRLFYKQLLTYTVYKSVWRAVTGKLAKWNKLKRTASVTVSFERSDDVDRKLMPKKPGSRIPLTSRQIPDNQGAGS